MYIQYKKTTYHPISSMSEVIEKIEHITLDQELYSVDGIIFSKD